VTQTTPLDIPSAKRQCSCGSSAAANNRLAKWTTAGGLFAAPGVCAACCLLPFVLISLGLAGARVGTRDSLARYKWPSISLAAVLLGYGYYIVYWRPKRQCAAGARCTARATGRAVRVGLWIAMVLAVSGLAFAQIEPLLAAAR
jgi:mercuric ion transport protein